MKKMMIFAALFATSTAFASCDREDVISEERLPRESKTFLKTHFDGVRVVSVMREVDGLEKEYSVWLENGFEIGFVRNGAWDEIAGHRQTLPASVIGLLPAGIETWVGEHYTGRPIVKVNRERWGYEIEIGPTAESNNSGNRGNVEVDFSEAGDFLRYDD
jgi:hypothetical protein